MYDMFHCYIAICCVQFVSLHDLQNTLHNLAGDSMMVGLRVAVRVRVRVRFSLRLEICKFCMRDFEMVHRILEFAQIDKSRATYTCR